MSHITPCAGHLEVAQCLLEAGASCNEYTFDGERCFYVALTPKLRELLTQYKQKPPPLGPLAMSLRPLSPLGADPEQVSTSQSDLSPGKFSDFAFQFQDEIIPLHRSAPLPATVKEWPLRYQICPCIHAQCIILISGRQTMGSTIYSSQLAYCRANHVSSGYIFL